MSLAEILERGIGANSTDNTRRGHRHNHSRTLELTEVEGPTTLILNLPRTSGRHRKSRSPAPTSRASLRPTAESAPNIEAVSTKHSRSSTRPNGNTKKKMPNPSGASHLVNILRQEPSSGNEWGCSAPPLSSSLNTSQASSSRRNVQVDSSNADDTPRHRKGKERSISHDRSSTRRSHHSLSSRKMPVVSISRDEDTTPGKSGIMSSAKTSTEDQYSGPLAVAEYVRLKQENESLKKAAHDSNKLLKKQKKQIEDLKSQIDVAVKAKKEQELEYQLLTSSSLKNEELVSAIEASVQCQICMDLLFNPYALSPCGHVLCLTCLQEWFRKAPTIDEDADSGLENNEYYVMHRQKSCPCCRATVTRRPAPVFVVKAVAAALAKAKGTLHTARSETANMPPNTDDDPWKGLFPPLEEEGSTLFGDDSEDGEEQDEEDEGMLDAWMGGWGGIEFSDSDEEDDSPHYVPPRWEPPSVDMSSIPHYSTSPGDAALMKMLRRGCTTEMVNIYHMEYDHQRGLSATLVDTDSFLRVIRNVVYLGWNITLDDDDVTGSRFMATTLCDLEEHPERWEIFYGTSALGDGWEATKLVPLDDIEEYNTTDTDEWVGAIEDD